MNRHSIATTVFRLTVFAALLVAARLAAAVDIIGAQEAALDMPRINAVAQPEDGGDPYVYENIFGDESINIFAFLDTGSSGVILSNSSAQALQLPREPGVTFSDVAIGGKTDFDVSQQIRLRIAATTAEDIDNQATYQSVYNHAFGPMRIQVGPTDIPTIDDLFESLDVFGMPVMQNKVVVIDPVPLNTLSDLLHTFLYDPGTAPNPNLAERDTNPGIPTTNHHVKLSYGDFGRFTETTPEGAPSPVINHNPFIGPNPLLALEVNPPPDNTPPVRMSFGSREVSGSILLDTGAAASFISTELAGSLGVRYVTGLPPDADPQLESFNPDDPNAPGTLIDDQFLAPIVGLGGQETLVGFRLDRLLLQTMEGSVDPNDPNNIRYLGAPVLVGDISVEDPMTGDTLTLDGIFGMNFLVASLAVDFGDARESPYNWITFDEPAGILGLDIAQVPEPSSYVMAGCGAIALAAYAWRRRRHTRRVTQG